MAVQSPVARPRRECARAEIKREEDARSHLSPFISIAGQLQITGPAEKIAPDQNLLWLV